MILLYGFSLINFCVVDHLLKAEVSVLSPRVAFLDHQRLILNVDNSAIKQRIAALAQDKIFKDGMCIPIFDKFFSTIQVSGLVYLHIDSLSGYEWMKIMCK